MAWYDYVEARCLSPHRELSPVMTVSRRKYAGRCSSQKTAQGRVESTLAQLHEVRAAAKAFRDGARLAVRNPDAGRRAE